VVNISVVGADRVPVRSGADRAMYGYFGQKREAEKVIAESGLPWTTLRATQFHDLVLTTATMMTRLPVVPVPGVRFQPIDASEVADRMAGLALGPPSGLVPEMGGPRTYLLADLLRSYWRATGTRRVVVPVRLPGGAARAFRDGANLSESRDGGRTWEQFLSDHVARTAPPDRSADAAGGPRTGAAHVIVPRRGRRLEAPRRAPGAPAGGTLDGTPVPAGPRLCSPLSALARRGAARHRRERLPARGRSSA
jgi:uncharacterized protein YbjT (DUF2867 family)